MDDYSSNLGRAWFGGGAPQASDAESITAELQRVEDTDLIINFGFLFLDKSKSGLLGSGGSARVYKVRSCVISKPCMTDI